MNAVTRPLVRYHGGKFKLAPWIIKHFPAHRVYVEPFGGGGSVLLRKERSYAEVYNDLDGKIVNVFRVARDHGPQLIRALELTPFAREEFELCYESSGDPIEDARRSILLSFAGFGSAAATGESTGFRANSNRSGTTPAHDWRNYPEALVRVVERLRSVVIEHRDASEVMLAHDGAETLHYVDPPYVHATRSDKRPNNYRHELTDDAHEALAATLHALQGAVVLSGYRCDLYDRLYAGWERVDVAAQADGARDRVESLWLSRGTPFPGLFLFDQPYEGTM